MDMGAFLGGVFGTRVGIWKYPSLLVSGAMATYTFLCFRFVEHFLVYLDYLNDIHEL